MRRFGRITLETEFENIKQFCLALLLRGEHVAVEVNGELTIQSINTSHVELVLVIARLGQFVKFGAVQRLVDLDQLVLDTRQRVHLVRSQTDQLVWKDLVLLQGQRLHFGPGKALDNPTLPFVFALLDLS